MKLADAAAIVTAGIEETLYYYGFPREHWRCLRTNNPLERCCAKCGAGCAPWERSRTASQP